MRTTMVITGVVAAGLVIVGWAPAMDAQKQDQKPRAGQICVLKVEGMTCGGCEAAVKMAAKGAEGVKDAKVSYQKGTAEITYDPVKTSPEAIAKLITEGSGFKASVPKKDRD